MKNRAGKSEYLRFVADVNSMALMIPGAALKLSGFGEQEQLEYRPLEDVIVVLKKHMTAPELLTAADQLHAVAVSLYNHLSKVCGPCEGCEDGEEGCPYDDLEDTNIGDLPPDLLDAFAEAGVCLGELEEHMILEDTVYGN